MGRPMKRSSPVRLAAVDVDAFLEQGPYSRLVAPLRGIDQPMVRLSAGEGRAKNERSDGERQWKQTARLSHHVQAPWMVTHGDRGLLHRPHPVYCATISGIYEDENLSLRSVGGRALFHGLAGAARRFERPMANLRRR